MARDRAIVFGGVLLLIAAIGAILVVRANQRLLDDGRNLDSVLVFADPAQCRTGEPLTRIARALRDANSGLGGAPPPIDVPGFPEPLRPRLVHSFGVGRDAIGFGTMAELQIRGRWHGLRVVGLRSTSADNPEIRFAEPPGRVRDTLLRAGFPLPAVDQWQQADYSPASPVPMTSVQSRRGGAALYCEPAGGMM